MDSFLQLGAGDLALVSHSAQLRSSGKMDRMFHLSANAGCRAESVSDLQAYPGDQLTLAATNKRSPGSFHYWISAVLALALIPFLKKLNLPVSFDWVTLGSAYWLVLAAQSIFVATLLCLIGFPAEESFRPAIRRLQQNKVRIAFWLVYFLILFWQLTWVKALILTIDTIAILEFRERLKPGTLGKALLAVFLPACYLFVGFLVVFAYNDIILSVSFYGAADPTFSAMDKWLLHGASVSFDLPLGSASFQFLFSDFCNSFISECLLRLGLHCCSQACITGDFVGCGS